MIAAGIPDQAVGFIAAIGILILGAGYGIGQWRAGGAKACADALQAATAELTVVNESRERLERDVAEARAEAQRLGGVVEQLREENHTLRSLVMGEKVPSAMIAAMETVAARTREELRGHLDQMVEHYLEPIRKAIGTRTTYKPLGEGRSS